MPNPCSDIESLVPTYLDGELAEQDVSELEEHLSDCSGCAEKVQAEASFLTGLRERLAPPVAPDLLRRRLEQTLNREDAERARAVRRARAAWILPASSVAVAAGALILFVASELRGPANHQGPAVTHEAVEDLFQPEPSVVEAGSRPELSQAAQEYTRSPVRAPRFARSDVRLRGLQRSRLLGQPAAVFVYEVRTQTGRHQVNVHTLDARDLDLSDLKSRDRRVVAGRELWAARSLGLSSVTFQDDGGIAYVFSSDMGLDELVDLVARSDLLYVVSDQLRR